MMDERTYFKPLRYQARLTKYSTNAYYIDFISRKEGLRDILLKVRVSDSTRFLREWLDDPQFWKPGMTSQERQEATPKLYENLFDKQQKEVDDFFPILFNQTLVAMCSVFDNFLCDCMRVVTFLKPDILKGLSYQEDISVAEAIDLKNYDEIFERVQGRVLKRFDFMGIKKKLDLFDKLGLSRSTLFSLNDKMSIKYPNSANFLDEIYSDRNDIVHRDRMKVNSFSELEKKGFLLMHIMIKWGAMDFRKQFNVDSDIQLTYTGALGAEYWDFK